MMKADAAIDTAMFAPCGMNCMVCYKHLGKKPCTGCMADDMDKPGHCRNCKIKNCAGKKNVSYCFECAAFPCVLIQNLEKSYQTRYGASLVENSLTAKKKGIKSFLAGNLRCYTCTVCGGVISMHDGDCSECGKAYILGRRRVKRKGEPTGGRL